MLLRGLRVCGADRFSERLPGRGPLRSANRRGTVVFCTSDSGSQRSTAGPPEPFFLMLMLMVGRAGIRRMWGPFFSETAVEMGLIPVTEHTRQRPHIAAPAYLTAESPFLKQSSLFYCIHCGYCSVGTSKYCRNNRDTVPLLFPSTTTLVSQGLVWSLKALNILTRMESNSIFITVA